MVEMVPLLIIAEIGSNKFAAVVMSADGLCPSPVKSGDEPSAYFRN